MKGYKATLSNMMCRNFQFELNKIHHHLSDEIICGKSGFHFCEQVDDVFDTYYPPLIGYDIRIFEINASGIISIKGNKRSCQTIQLIRELDLKELMIHYSHLDDVRYIAANRNYMLDVLQYDNNDTIRTTAQQNRKLLNERL